MFCILKKIMSQHNFGLYNIICNIVHCIFIVLLCRIELLLKYFFSKYYNSQNNQNMSHFKFCRKTILWRKYKVYFYELSNFHLVCKYRQLTVFWREIDVSSMCVCKCFYLGVPTSNLSVHTALPKKKIYKNVSAVCWG